MLWLYAGYVLATWSQFYINSHNIESFFVFNQTVTRILWLPNSSLLYRLGYNLFLYRLGYNLLYINTSSFWSRSSMHLTELSRLARKNYLQISTFLNPVMVKQKRVSHTLWKATGGAISKVVRKQLTGRSQAWILEH